MIYTVEDVKRIRDEREVGIWQAKRIARAEGLAYAVLQYRMDGDRDVLCDILECIINGDDND